MTTAPTPTNDLDAGRDRYPALLTELAQLIGQKLGEIGIEPERAAAIGQTVAEHVRQHYGGQLVYITKGASFETRQRWQAMWRDFRGDNHAELARKYGMNIKQVYRVLALMAAEHRKRAQPELQFDAPGAAEETPR